MEDLLFDMFFENIMIDFVEINIDFDFDGIFDHMSGGILDLDHNYTSDWNGAFMDFDHDGVVDQFDSINDIDMDFTNDSHDTFFDLNENYINDVEDPFQDWDNDGIFDGYYFQYRRMITEAFASLEESSYE